MKDHTGMERAFIWSSRAWYAEAAKCTGEISLGMYAKDDGTTGEMSIKWRDLGDRRVPRLECFDDGWHALSTFSDLLDELGKMDDENPTEEEVIDVLLRCGFADHTAYTREGGTDGARRVLRDLERQAAVLREEIEGG